MKTRLKLFNGRKVTIEQTITAIKAKFDDETETRNITSDQYMKLVWQGVPISGIL